MANLRRLWRTLLFLGSTGLTMAAILLAGMILMTPKGAPNVQIGPFQTVLDRLNLHEPDLQTMVVGSTLVTEVPPEAIWRTLTNLPAWSQWCPMTRGSVGWVEGYRWVPGAQFQHEVELGFPLGSARTVAFVERVNPGSQLVWVEQRRGAFVCRVWQIDPLPNGGSRVTCVEASRSLSTAVTRPFTVGPLQRTFEEAVERLIAQAAKDSGVAAPKTDSAIAVYGSGPAR